MEHHSASGADSAGRRGGGILNVLIAVVILGVAIGGALYVFGGWSTSTGNAERTDIAVARQPATTHATLSVMMGAGSITVGGGGAGIVSGVFRSTVATMATAETTENETQTVALTAKNKGGFRLFGGTTNDLDIALNADTRYALDLTVGATTLQLNLADVLVEQLDLSAGASTMTLTLGDLVDGLDVRLAATASNVFLRLPRSLGVVLTLRSAVGRSTLPGFKQEGTSTYRSDGYEEAPMHASIDIDASVSSLTVTWLEV